MFFKMILSCSEVNSSVFNLGKEVSTTRLSSFTSPPVNTEPTFSGSYQTHSRVVNARYC